MNFSTIGNVLEHSKQYEHIEREIGLNEERSSNFLTQCIITHLHEEEIPVINPPTHKDGRVHTVTMKGPYSPLEIGLFGLTNNASGAPKIDTRSVNHVLLENESNDMSEKYMVAVIQHQNDEHSPVTVRQTTMMPNIRLFGPIMAAIFAPKMKLLRSQSKTHYIKMMTGLGLDDNGACLSPLTNMKFDLDVELKNSDVTTVSLRDLLCKKKNPFNVLNTICRFQINSIRLSINKLLSEKCFRKYTKKKVLNYMETIQNDLIGFVKLQIAKTKL